MFDLGPALTLGQLLDRAAAPFPDGEAVVFKGERVTYRELKARVEPRHGQAPGSVDTPWRRLAWSLQAVRGDGVGPLLELLDLAGAAVRHPEHDVGAGAEGEGEEPPGEVVESAHYWISSSARTSTDGGIVSPSARAVLRLMTSSNFVGQADRREPVLQRPATPATSPPSRLPRPGRASTACPARAIQRAPRRSRGRERTRQCSSMTHLLRPPGPPSGKRYRRANSSFAAVTLAGSASRSKVVIAIALAAASIPAVASGFTAASAKSRV